jgi:hypothetical protein
VCRYNVDAVHLLLRAGLVAVTAYDTHLAALMEQGSNYEAVAFANRLLKMVAAAPGSRGLTPSDLPHTCSVLMAASSGRRGTGSSVQMAEHAAAQRGVDMKEA